MRKIMISATLIAFWAAALPSLANAQAATEGAASGAVVGGVAGAAVGGPVGAAVGAGVGGTVGAAAGDTNRAPPRSDTVIVAPAAPASERTCVTDSTGVRTCTTINR
ncbi:MAG: hypothetical protein JO245_08980 [Pseudolabrys sp.]|nr:hypothetical protein [Pseudolabrys sp.]